MSNPQKNQGRLGYILLAVALAILLMFYSDAMEASDVQVTCFTNQELVEIDAAMTGAMSNAYELGRTDGVNLAYDKIVETLHRECHAGAGTVTFPHSEQGTIVMVCPAK